MNSMEGYRERIVAEYPGVFEGLGTLGEPYVIELSQDHKPLSIFVPRMVPYPLQDKVKDELSRMERSGVMSRI